MQIPETENYPWGIAHSRRGLKYHEQAILFISSYPKGTIFAEGEELVRIGRKLFDCDEDAYYAPSYFARKLTISGTHPRMGTAVFAVVLSRAGVYKVLDPLRGWQNFDMGDALEKKVTSLLTFHNYKLQGKSFIDLPLLVQKGIRRVYKEYQRVQELNAVLHAPIIEALDDLAEALTDYNE